PIYCQEAANPNVYHPYNLPQDIDVTFVGQAYGDRPAYIEHLWNVGIAVRAWGHGWKIDPKWPPMQDSPLWRLPESICGSPLPDTEMIQLYSRSKINLGFSTCGETHKTRQRILQVRLRDFEVPMSGGFYMVEQMEELAEFFEPGKEIVFYNDKDDLLSKIRYYLTHETEREKIRLAGLARARRDHTWHRRFQTSFAAMGLT
ncbi:MAG TPA: glycosyltransferase, partial [Phycisphaerae bacterium]